MECMLIKVKAGCKNLLEFEKKNAKNVQFKKIYITLHRSMESSLICGRENPHVLLFFVMYINNVWQKQIQNRNHGTQTTFEC